MTIKVSKGMALGVIGAILAAGGTVLPWLTATSGLVGSLSRSGLEMGDDALILAGAGVIGGLAFVSGLSLGSLVGAALGIVVLYVGWTDFTELQGRTGTEGLLISVGPGIYVSLLGGALMVLGAIVALREGRADTVKPPAAG